ncbi:uncharacterized protein HaLaN_21466, partial [Haematococcus lacustris]
MAGLYRNLAFMMHGSKHFGRQGYEAASKHFDDSVMQQRLDGRTCLVTGANQGLGRQLSEELAARGATLLMVCRDPTRGKAAVQAVQTKTGNKDVQLKVCDISDLSSVAALAAELKAGGVKLHLLVNNAGVMVHERQRTQDGLDVNFATNTLGCFVISLLLEPLLVAAAPSKVIFVSSGGMLTQKLDVDDMQNEHMRSYDGTVAYARDKRRQVAIAERLAELWANKGVGVYSMHPGWTLTEGVKKSIPSFYNFYKDKFRDPGQGTDTLVYLALQDPAKLQPGGFYLDRAPQAKHLTLGCTQYSAKEVDRLWSQL